MPNPGAPNPATPRDAASDWPQREAALLARIRTHGVADRSAWNELLAHHQDRLFAVCQRMVGREAAADLTQDSMVKVLQGLDGYDGRSQLSTWMIRIAMNTCLSWLRGQKLRRHKPLDQSETASVRSFGTQGSTGELPPPSSVQEDERRVAVSLALSELPDDQRAILVLRDVQGLEYDQIAVVLDVPGGTVKSRLFRARMALREVVEARLKNAASRGGGVEGTPKRHD
jgi:RNA polymerase sigma-70 factor (ECF subfamily)